MNIKKIFVYIFILSLILSLTGCGGQSDTDGTTAENTTNETVTTQEPVETQTPEPTSEPKQQEQTSKQTEPSANTSSSAKNETETASRQQNYQNVSNFNIKGKWKNVGTYTFGQVQSGAIVVFDGKNCNVYSPQDTYAFYKDGDSYTLDCTSLLFSETLSFKVKIVDKDNIHIYYGSNYLELKRVE